MNAPEFVTTVREMRAAQKRYFTEGRKQFDLIEAKRLEKIVDMALAEDVVSSPMREEHLAFMDRLQELEWESGMPVIEPAE